MNNNLLRNPESDDHQTVLLAKCEEVLEDVCAYCHLCDLEVKHKVVDTEYIGAQKRGILEKYVEKNAEFYSRLNMTTETSHEWHLDLSVSFRTLQSVMEGLLCDEILLLSKMTYVAIRDSIAVILKIEMSPLTDNLLEEVCRKVLKKFGRRNTILLDEKITLALPKLLQKRNQLKIFEEYIVGFDEVATFSNIFKKKLQATTVEIEELCALPMDVLSVPQKEKAIVRIDACISALDNLEKNIQILMLHTKEEVYSLICSNPDDPDQLEYRQDLAKHIGAKYVGMFREENGWYASYLYGEDKSGIVHVSGKVVPGVAGNAVYYKDKGVFLGKAIDRDEDVLSDIEGNILFSYRKITACKGESGTFFLGISEDNAVDFVDSKGVISNTTSSLADGSDIVQLGALVAVNTTVTGIAEFFLGEAIWSLYNERGEVMKHPCLPAYSFEELEGSYRSVYQVKNIYTLVNKPDENVFIYWNEQRQSVGEVTFPTDSKVEVQHPWIYGSFTSKRENSIDGIMIRFHNMLSGETIETDHIANISPEFLTSGCQTSKGTFQELLLYMYGAHKREGTVPLYAVGIETRGFQYGDTSTTNSVVTVKKLPEYKNEPLRLEVTYASITYELCVQVEDSFFQKKFHPILELLPHEIRDQVGEFIKNHRLHTNLYHRAAIEEIWIEPEMEAVLFLRGRSLYMYKQGKEELLHDPSIFYLDSHSRPFRKGSDGSWRTLMDRPVISHPKEYFLTLSLDAPAGKRVHTGSLNRVIQAGEGLFWVVHYDKTEQPTGSVALYDECYQYLMTMGELEATEICDVSGELPQFRDGVVKFGKKGEEYYLSKKGRRVFS